MSGLPAGNATSGGSSRKTLGILLIAGIGLPGCHQRSPQGLTQVNNLSIISSNAAVEQQPQTRLENISAPAAASPLEEGPWTMPSRDYANTRYGGLDEITTENVSKLQRWRPRCGSSRRSSTPGAVIWGSLPVGVRLVGWLWPKPFVCSDTRM